MIINTLTNKNAEWPNVFDSISPQIKKLYVSGEIPNSPRLGVIGTRRPTEYGKWAVNTLVSEIAGAGVCIVSGLAIGIDGLAHTAALNNSTTTIAVLPSPLDKVYPARHQQMANKIVAGSGATVSEYESGQAVHKANFIARNRIIAALSDVLLVVEAAHQSGTMHTVAFASQIGVDVAAVPGPINHHTSSGTNQLIQDGAHTVTKADDLFHLLKIQRSTNQKIDLNEIETKVYNCLLDKPMSIAEIANNDALTDADVLLAITSLEINNLVARLDDGMYARR